MLLRRLATIIAAAFVASATFHADGRTTVTQEKPQAAAARPFTVEYYYKVEWGHFDEFMELYMRNHYPILQRLQKMGRIVSMSAAYPINHASEPARWDMRFTIVWKDAATAYEDFDQSSIVKELYPDQEKFKKEEQRRFQLLLEHTDIPVYVDDLSQWK